MNIFGLMYFSHNNIQELLLNWEIGEIREIKECSLNCVSIFNSFLPYILYTIIPLYHYTTISLCPLYLYIPQGRYRRLFLAIRINPLYQVLQTKPHLPEFQQLLNSRRQFLLLFQNMNLNPINYGQ